MKLGTEMALEASNVALRLEVEASELVQTTLELLRRDEAALRSGRYGDGETDIGDVLTLGNAVDALEHALERYYLPPERSGVPA